MRIAVIGSGYVGLVTGACLARAHQVTMVDSDISRIRTLQDGGVPIYEPGLRETLYENCSRIHYRHSTDVQKSSEIRLVFLCVGTPSAHDGSADLTYMRNAVDQAHALFPNAVLAIKSTVPVGTAALLSAETGLTFASVPEFLAEGTALEDFMFPDRVVIGGNGDDCAVVARALEKAVAKPEEVEWIVGTSNQTAELIKYASNSLLAARLSLVNEIADVCEAVGGDVNELFRGVGMDSRIGRSFLRPGPAWGGSCFGKDVRALAYVAGELGQAPQVLNAAILSNDRRHARMLDCIVSLLTDAPSQRVAILGASFKAGTDDMRESAAIELADALGSRCRGVSIHDPVVLPVQFEAVGLSEVTFYSDVNSALHGADLAVVMTDHDEYAHLDLEHVAHVMRGNLVYDARRIWDHEAAEAAGLHYYGVGHLRGIS